MNNSQEEFYKSIENDRYTMNMSVKLSEVEIRKIIRILDNIEKEEPSERNKNRRKVNKPYYRSKERY